MEYSEHQGARGRTSWSQEGKRPNTRTGLKSWLQIGEEPLVDAHRGQIVLVMARWVLIVVGMFLTLHAPADLVELQVAIVGILGMSVVNFVLHTNLLMKRPASEQSLYLASAGDIILITAMVGMSGGIDSYTLVFYFPAIIAYSLVFPLRVTLLFTAGLLSLYAFVTVSASEEILRLDREGFAATLVTRLITFVGVMAVANMYRLVEAQRLEDETQAQATRSRRRRPSRPSSSAAEPV